LEVIITETGVGINPEDQRIIFNNFTRLGNSSLHSSGKTEINLLLPIRRSPSDDKMAKLFGPLGPIDDAMD
jgi:hypothetical protein